MDNRALAKFFDIIGDLLEIKGENAFRVRSYRRAAQTIDRHSEPIEKVAAEGRLLEIDGIGKSIAEKIFELLDTGELGQLDSLLEELPRGLLDLLEIPGLGPKKVKLLWEKLGVTNAGMLESACKEDRVKELPGMGAKTQEKLLKGIELLRNRAHAFLLGRVRPKADGLLTELRELDEVGRASYAGSARRGKETVGDMDILATSSDPEATMEWFRSMPGVQDVLVSGPTKTSLIWHDGLQVDLRIVPEESFGAALQYFTGSKEHNVRIRETGHGSRDSRSTSTASTACLAMNVWAARTRKTSTKRSVWKCRRRNSGRAREKSKPRKKKTLPNLISIDGVRGDLHAHTQWSDGKDTIEDMAGAAMERGYEYLAVTDHSKSLQIARGLSIEDLLKQIETIREFNKKQKQFQLFCGSEVDITSSGELDYPDEVLQELDIVVASIHTGLEGDREKQTRRTLAACENPYVNVIGHMTGRLIGRREPFPLDASEVFRAAAETGTALEINANPFRLDLCDVHAREAQQLGATIAINTDAHSIKQLDYMEYGIATARRGWLEPDAVLNAWPLSKVRTFLRKKR